MRSAKRQPGFTLLEVLLALGMISMLALSLYASLRVAFKARDAASDAVTPARTASVAMELLRQDLENALPPTPNSVLDGAFMGQPMGPAGAMSDALQFCCTGGKIVRNSTDPTQAGVVQQVELSVETPEGSSSPALVRRVIPKVSTPRVIQPAGEILCRNVKAFGLRYFDGTLWQDTWDSTAQGNVLPVAVEVTLAVQVPLKRASAPVSYQVTRVFTLACGGGGS